MVYSIQTQAMLNAHHQIQHRECACSTHSVDGSDYVFHPVLRSFYRPHQTPCLSFIARLVIVTKKVTQLRTFRVRCAHTHIDPKTVTHTTVVYYTRTFISRLTSHMINVYRTQSNIAIFINSWHCMRHTHTHNESTNKRWHAYYILHIIYIYWKAIRIWAQYKRKHTSYYALNFCILYILWYLDDIVP